MPRKRKVREANGNSAPPQKRQPKNQRLVAIVLQAQDTTSRHDKLIKELQTVYGKSNHGEFLSDFLIIMRSTMVHDINNEFSNNILTFCAKFVAAYNTEETHPIVADVFGWILSTSSRDVNVRFRLCEFVNLVLKYLGDDAVLDDNICDNILKYMTDRMGDINANIRTQAVYALQRLQIPDDPNDVILKQYFFHLGTDPSVKMRQAIVTSIGRNMNTMPAIIERLWDVDEKMRRHVILQMSTHPVRSYKVAERLTFLEQGLNDHSELVRKATTNVMLPRWVASYGDNYITFVGALKLDTNDKEMQRFRKCAIQALQHIFKKDTVSNIVTALGFAAPEKPRKQSDDDEEEEEEMETTKPEEFPRCVPLKSLSIEVAVYWEAAVSYLQEGDFDELNAILPELSTFCQYVEKYCESIHFETDKWQQMKNQYILLSLLEIVAMYDLGDEVGRQNLKNLMRTMLTKYEFDELNISVISRILEQVYPISDARLQTVVDIVHEILHIGESTVTIDSAMETSVLKDAGIDLKLKVSELKVKMMDLKEQENAFVQKKDYANAQKATEEWALCNEEYIKLLHPLIMAETDSAVSSESIFKAPEKITTDMILKCLQITFYTISSKHTKSITPQVVNLYSEFICRHMDSQHAATREWAFKCATTCSMLYSMLAKEVSRKLSDQFVKNHNIRIWTAAIECLFELVDRYGLEFFGDTPSEEDTTVGKVTGKKSRQLFSSSLLENPEQDTSLSVVETFGHLSHLLENCEHSSIVQALIMGFCRFVLHGHYTESNIVSKLMLFYFNPATEPEINQILGIFFETLTKERKQEYLQPALLPTLFIIFEAPIDSPLQEIKPETVMKFVIDVTQPQYCSPGLNIHNTIGMSFINAMQDNVTQKELLKVLSKGLLILEISDDPNFRKDLKNCCDQLLKVTGLDEKVAKNISIFKDVLDGIKRPSLTFSSTRMTGSLAAEKKDSDGESEEEGDKTAEMVQTPKDPTLGTIAELTEEQSTILDDSEKTENGGEEILAPETPSINGSQNFSAIGDSVSLSQTQKTPGKSPQQSSQASDNSEVIEASFDETVARRKGVSDARSQLKRTLEPQASSQRAKVTRSTVKTRTGTNKEEALKKTAGDEKKATVEKRNLREKTTAGIKKTDPKAKKAVPEKKTAQKADLGKKKLQRGKVVEGETETDEDESETDNKTETEGDETKTEEDESEAEEETATKGKKSTTKVQKPSAKTQKSDSKSKKGATKKADEKDDKETEETDSDEESTEETDKDTASKRQKAAINKKKAQEKVDPKKKQPELLSSSTKRIQRGRTETLTSSQETLTSPVVRTRRGATSKSSSQESITKTPSKRGRPATRTRVQEEQSSASKQQKSVTPSVRTRKQDAGTKTPSTRTEKPVSAVKTPLQRTRLDVSEKTPTRTKSVGSTSKTPSTAVKTPTATPSAASKTTPIAASKTPVHATRRNQSEQTPTREAKTPSSAIKRAQTRNEPPTKKTPTSLSQSSSASSVKSGPTTPKRVKSTEAKKTETAEANPHKTRRAAAQEFATKNVMTRKRVQQLSPTPSQLRSRSQDVKGANKVKQTTTRSVSSSQESLSGRSMRSDRKGNNTKK
ncbi:condensin complex subunit 3 [Lutzomyia longipalpis]|uniref:condensin complex subunit 3 n=1 Tax=Lutzomyia longipalpis TaxID=7200 RepID=UPI0024842874|nr:condensin complex subunit 3 [Lutzomyia longipalpis]